MEQENEPPQHKTFVLLLFLMLLGSLFSTSSQAQVTPDQTLGVESSTVHQMDTLNERIDGGARRGGNLFHSFQEFNINEGRGVDFANPQGIMNIFSRVTGGNSSQILGRLGVLGEANLFFLNPNGIIFGPNSSLDIRGSLLVSTASSIQFADGTEFRAITPQNNSLLTVSVPIGLQFDSSPASIVNQSRFTTLLPSFIDPSTLEPVTVGLFVLPGKTLALVGGDINLEGGNLTAFQGRIELGAVDANSTVSISSIGQNWQLDYQQVQNFKNIALSNQSSVDASSTDVTIEDSSKISIYSKNLFLTDESRIISFSDGAKPAGAININVSETVEITGTGTYVQALNAFSTSTISQSQLGNGIFSVNFGSGGSNDIAINTRRLIGNNGAFIVTSNFGQGQGGNLIINAQDSVELGASLLATGTGNGGGDAGDLTIITGKLIATETSIVSSSTLGQGKGGTINVHADSVHLIGGQLISVFNDSFLVNTSLISGTTGVGDSGDIRVETGQLILQDGAQLSANTNTLTEGKSGNIQVEALSILLKNNSFIFTLSLGEANAGQIIMRVHETLQVDNSTITARAERATGGNINITASKIDLVGNSDITTNVTSGTGEGGNIILTADSIILFNDSDILAFAQDGIGGNITLNTPVFFGNGYQATNKNRDPDTLNNNNLADINASGAVSGVIRTPDLTFIQNSLFELSETLINPDNLIANSCVVPNQQKAGTFILTGSDGLPTRPNTTITSPYPTGTIEIIPIPSNSPSRPKIVEPQGFYHLPNGQIVLSRKCL